MDHLDQHLATSALDLSLPASIRATTTLGKCTLDKYYTMTNHSEMYRIAMGKFHYLRTYPTLIYLTASPTSMPQAWLLQDGQVDKEWIDAARQIVHDKFECTYKALPDADLPTRANGEQGTSSKKVHYIQLRAI